MKKMPIIVIVGPTAVGKTKLSIEIAKKFNGEIINSDSTQIFQGTDIATNKVTKSEMEKIEHHLLSIKKVNESYSSADFQKDSREVLSNILLKEKLPIIVGGSGLYVNALIKNYKFLENNSSNYDYSLSNEELFLEIQKMNLEESKKVHINNRQRLLTIYAKLKLFHNNNLSYNSNEIDDYYYDNLIIIGLNSNREILYKRINDRVLELVKIGLFEEIKKAFKDCDFNKKAQSLKCIGGQEIISFLEKEISYEECIKLMQQNNRNYAKKQITWFKNQLTNVTWFEHNYDNFEIKVQEILTFLEKQIKILL